MDAKQYLKRIELLRTKIANLSTEVTGAGNYPEYVKKPLLDEIIELRQQMSKAVEIFDGLNLNEYNVMYNKYVLGKDYNDIADKAGKSYSWVTTIHGNAKRKIQSILEARNGEKQQDQETEEKKNAGPDGTQKRGKGGS